MKMGASCKALHIKSALHSPRVYAIPEVTSQIGKQCKPVQVHSFSRFSPLGQSSQIACWGKHPQAPLNDICDTGCTIFQSFCKKQNFSFLSSQKKVMTATTPSGTNPLSVKSLQSSLSYLSFTGAWHAPVISPKEKFAIGNSVERHAHPDNADGLLLVLPG